MFFTPADLTLDQKSDVTTQLLVFSVALLFHSKNLKCLYDFIVSQSYLSKIYECSN